MICINCLTQPINLSHPPADSIAICFSEHPELSHLQELDLPSAAQTVYLRQTSQEALSFLPVASLEQEGVRGESIDVICFLARAILWYRWSTGLMLS